MYFVKFGRSYRKKRSGAPKTLSVSGDPDTSVAIFTLVVNGNEYIFSQVHSFFICKDKKL